jgi:pyrimidine-nucleoside phosphorylase
MRAYDIILNKRNGVVLTAEEIDFFIKGYTHGDIPESQMAAWLMAVFFKGLNRAETSHLTASMVASGVSLDLSSIPGIKVDKHSTGGVGDKTTLVLVPVLAAAGVPVAKMSGRSLGFTGGTLDKLEAIPGFSTALTPDQLVSQVKGIGAAIAGQTMDLVPADKKMYALRDLTATVDCIPLIASSVMSKKLASGADAIVLDVKVGSGAFCADLKQARELAKSMVDIGNRAGRDTVAVITGMDQPLGRAVGNALEVVEAIQTLRGDGPDDLVELCAVLGGIALMLGKEAESRKEGEETIRDILGDGRGLTKFKEIIEAQGGDVRVVDDPSLLPTAPVVHEVLASSEGFVTRCDAMGIACAATALGAGRGAAGASPDPAVGVVLNKKIGDKVATGEILAWVHARTDLMATDASQLVAESYCIEKQQGIIATLVYETID